MGKLLAKHLALFPPFSTFFHLPTFFQQPPGIPTKMGFSGVMPSTPNYASVIRLGLLHEYGGSLCLSGFWKSLQLGWVNIWYILAVNLGCSYIII